MIDKDSVLELINNYNIIKQKNRELFDEIVNSNTWIQRELLRLEGLYKNKYKKEVIKEVIYNMYKSGYDATVLDKYSVRLPELKKENLNKLDAEELFINSLHQLSWKINYYIVLNKCYSFQTRVIPNAKQL